MALTHRQTIHMRMLTAFFLMLMPMTLWGQSTSVNTNAAYLAAAVDYLEDPQARLTLSEVQDAYRRGEFTRHDSPSDINFGLTSSAYWLRLVVNAPTPPKTFSLLEIGFYALTDVALFHPDGRVDRTGAYQPAGERPWAHRHLVFPIQPKRSGQSVYYLRVTSQGSVTVPLTLWDPNAFSNHTQQSYFWIATYFGLIVALFVFSFFVFLTLRSTRYLYYCGFLFFTGLGMFFMNGLGGFFFNPLGWPKAIGTNTLYSLSGMFAVLFLRSFFETQENMPSIDKVMQILIGGFAFVALLPLTGASVRDGVSALSIIALVAGPILLGVTVKNWLRGEPGANILMIGWRVLLGAVMVQSARNLDWVPTNFFTLNVLQIFSLVEMGLFAFALAQQIAFERKERARFQALANQRKEALITQLRESEERLQQTVEKRTRSLSRALVRERKMMNDYFEFGSLVAHEFRNPLAIISTQAEVAKHDRRVGGKVSAHRYEAIERAVERLRVLFNRWLDPGVGKLGIKEISKSLIWLDQWLPAVIARDRLNDQQRISLEVSHLAVIGDEEMLTTALVNLLDNALKYSTPDSWVEVKTIIEGDQVGIAVTDQGVGIDSSDFERLCEKQYRGGAATDAAGQGLGLYFVKQIMDAHNGSLVVDSVVGQGSRFTMWIPRVSQSYG